MNYLSKETPKSKRLLPSTSMLAAFDAAARTGSFTAAAKELALTQGAISRQVNALELQLSVCLFHRNKQNITLTEVGKNYAKEVNSALSHIRSATLNLMTNPDGGILNIAVLPMFGSRWLMPRLADFLAKHPQITINTVSKLSQFDFSQEDVHCAIHFGKADWLQANCTFLMAEESVPVCSPRLFQKAELAQADNVCANLIDLPLLHISTRPEAWQQWFNEHKVISKTLSESKAKQGMHFEQFSIATNAAVAGLGVALLPRFLIENELRRGELQVICDQPQRTDNGYYLVTPNDKLNYPPVLAFTHWLTQILVSENTSVLNKLNSHVYQ
ncbi:LysR family transcriptional regulator [Colwellia sp. 12G3]|uniref:LysR family transcriptional regulator n=1 Tax=Colwellia sp. 12G3 TaxID=2058299 RepID=UPI000C34B206|nr:LysR family transcriptional regulator [Colwellia sp. 12G3]PKI16981.1 LysR family transcriptional regulator [Colwellia sp. 12G3]